MNLAEKYIKKAVPKMKEKFGYKNSMAVPKIEKVVINTGFGRLIAGKTSSERKKVQEGFVHDIGLIVGQKPVLTKAKQSISGFKLRQGMLIGASATLRKKKMWDFLERFINIALPRSRDFRGLNPKSVDKQGNLTIPIKEHICFPEISPEKTRETYGLEVTVKTTAKTREQGLELLRLIGFPIKKN